MSRRRQLSDEEQALWAGFARSIKPLKSAKPGAKTGLKSSATPSVASTPAPSPPRSHPVTPRETRPAPSPPLAPLGRRLKQRVARGREPIDARIDLHGMTQQAGACGAAAVSASRPGRAAPRPRSSSPARVCANRRAASNAMPTTSPACSSDRCHCGSRLPEFRPLIVGFDDAHVGHGGEGALYVRLRRASRPRC